MPRLSNLDQARSLIEAVMNDRGGPISTPTTRTTPLPSARC